MHERACVCSSQEATLIVGMHPDQAVDAIVDAALHLGVPFFVVPCCVYAQDFPHRRGPGGGPVTTHAELLDYLQAKAPDIRRAHLPFAGQNVCLYRLPPLPPTPPQVRRPSWRGGGAGAAAEGVVEGVARAQQLQAPRKG